MYESFFKFAAPIGFVLLVVLASCNSQTATRTPTPTGQPEQATAAVVLPIDRQEQIWAIEHAAFELEQKFGRSLKQALREGDTEAIQAFCRTGFEARIPNSSKQVQYDLEYISASKTVPEIDTSSVHGPARFAEYLKAYFDDFETIENVTCRVLDLQADEGDSDAGCWAVTLYLAATGKSPEQQFVEFTSEHQLRCTFADDETIESGVILDQWTVHSEERRRSAQSLFEEVTSQVGLGQVDLHDNWQAEKERVRQYHTQMAVADFDRDGYHDIAIASASGRWQLLASIAGKQFKEVTDEQGLPSWADAEPRSRSVRDEAYLATWIDIDNDGFSDLILGDRLFKNHAGKRFEDITDQSGLVFAYNPRGCVVADYDCDGRLDLYVLYQGQRTPNHGETVGWVGDDETGRENHLWRNMGDGRFENTTEFANAGGGNRQSFAASWFQANEDHFPDLYVANDFGTNVLLMNRGNGTFEDASQGAGVSDYATSMGVATGDLTGDGRPEIYVANMFSKMGRRIIAHVTEEDYPEGVFRQIQGSCAGNRLYTAADSATTYQEISEVGGVNTVGWAYAPALADFDADGQLDIYSTTGFLSYQRHKPDG